MALHAPAAGWARDHHGPARHRARGKGARSGAQARRALGGLDQDLRSRRPCPGPAP